MITTLKKVLWRPIFRTYSMLSQKYTNRFIIPEYSEKRTIILSYQKKYNSKTFVETGTLLGDTVEMMKSHFNSLYSIELSKELALKAQDRFSGNSNIKIIEGDSGEVLKELVPTLKKPVLFWLDGHYSHEFFIGGQYIITAKSEKQTPILKELESILKKGIESNVILIDDARCFIGRHDYPSLKELKKYLLRFGVKNEQVLIKRDIIRIVP